MDFIFIANAWSAGKDNPTSKHRIALELIRRGNRVLWIEGSGMRTPSMGSSSDRLRMVRKVVAALRGAREEGGISREDANNAKGSDAVSTEGRGNNSFSRSSRLRVKQSSLWVLSPLFIPLPKYELIRRLNGLIGRFCMRFWSWRLGFHDPVLINYVPVLAEAMRCRLRRQTLDYRPETIDLSEAPPVSMSDVYGLGSKVSRCAPRIVYHCVDRWDAFSNYDARMMAEMDRRCCQYADLVIASSQDLVDRCRRYNNNVHLVSHGVDHQHFSRALQVVQRPVDLPPGPVVGFFGLLSEWLDQDLLIEVARRLPECALVLIGKADVDVERLKGIRNVHLLGPRSFSQLPEYVAYFDVGLIPFVVNELTKAVNPIKLREMLSAGCPVVSTALPEVQGYRGVGVMVAGEAAKFVEAVAGHIRHPATAAERKAISDGVAHETWEAKVSGILGLIEGEKDFN
jgi:glycosyltransferase involved in cell wall biosynthesis